MKSSLGWIFTSIVFIGGRNYTEIPALSFNGWLSILSLGIFCSGLVYTAWYDALQALYAANTGVFLYIEPLIAMVVTFFVLDEAITVASIAGGGVITFGVWLVNRN